MLTAAGYDVLTATSGDIALAQYQEAIADIDVLLTDVVVPGSVQGPVLAQRLSALNPELKVVFMSGYPNEAAVNGNGLRPNDRFLMKPVLRKDLLNTIAAAVAETEKG
jgi:DNA-binding NtrC family response regulator